MARSYRPVVRDQEFLLPPNMADWLPEDHLVWFVLDIVDRLDTRVFHAGRRIGGVGRQGYDPDMLLALLIYAYAVGERSSRRIERLCVDHVAFRVLCGQDGPDHSTIARFRAEHHEGFADLFAQVLRLCAAAGMVKVGIVSIDGTKIAANASKSANRSTTGSARKHNGSPQRSLPTPMPSTRPKTTRSQRGVGPMTTSRLGSPPAKGERRTSRRPWRSWTVKTPSMPKPTPRIGHAQSGTSPMSRQATHAEGLRPQGLIRCCTTRPGSGGSVLSSPNSTAFAGRRPAPDEAACGGSTATPRHHWPRPTS